MVRPAFAADLLPRHLPGAVRAFHPGRIAAAGAGAARRRAGRHRPDDRRGGGHDLVSPRPTIGTGRGAGGMMRALLLAGLLALGALPGLAADADCPTPQGFFDVEGNLPRTAKAL